MLPKALAMGRSAKASSTGAPRRLMAGALIGFMAAFLLLAYVLFLLAGFLSLHYTTQENGGGVLGRDVQGLLRELHAMGTSGTESLVALLVVIASALLIQTPAPRSPRTSPDAPAAGTAAIHSAGEAEMQALLYHGRPSPAPGRTAAIGSHYHYSHHSRAASAQPPSNGGAYHSSYKTDVS